MKFKVGDRVVPHAKTVPGLGGLGQSGEWGRAQGREQPFLYVTWTEKQLGDGTPCLICSSYKSQGLVGDYFMPDDVTLYEEETETEVTDQEEPEVVQQEMGDVIIYSQCCSREDLAELVEYLETKCWDYRIIQRGKQ